MSPEQPIVLILASVATGIAFFYSVWIGFSRYEVLALFLFWSAYVTMKLLAWWSWDRPLEVQETTLRILVGLMWIMITCVLFAATSCVVRCCRKKGSPLPFVGGRENRV